MKISALLLAFILSSIGYSQEKSILVFDLVHKTLDSITEISFDSTILSENTIQYPGCFNQSIEVLDTNLPTSNLYPGSQFTRKKRASLDFNLNNYPIRTTVKIFREHNDALQDLCSGNMISKKHVITATHCVSNINTNQLISDSLYLSPAFDNGEFNTNFPGSKVSKVYFISNWSLQGEDIAILELEKPIGELTGWLSIGFNNQDTLLKKGIFYKFSYPSSSNSIIDPNEYNGDSLYYNYGVVNNVSKHRISINNASGVGGESGSSIIKIENGEKYVSYGVLSFANNLSHSRINNWRYYAIKSIINNDLVMKDIEIEENIVVYPNPSANFIQIKHSNKIEVIGLALFDSTGRKYRIKYISKSCLKIDTSILPDGIYYLSVTTPNNIISKKIIKNSYH